MKKNPIAILCLAVFISTFFATSCFALEFGARANYWIPAFKGDLRIDRNGVRGTELNLKDDLGISNENVPSVEAYFGMGNHEISLMYSRVNLSGTKNITKPIVFYGNTYALNAAIDSELNINMIDLEYQYKIVNIKAILAGLTIGIIGKVKYFDGETRLRSATVGSAFDNKQEIHAPIPMIGVGAKVGILLNILEARAKVTGMTYSGSFFYDALADIAVTPFPFLDIHAGYRAMSLKIDNVSDVYANMTFAGPYFGVAIGF